MELYSLTIHEAQVKLRHGEISSVDLTESVLARINQVEAQVGAYISVQPDLALQMAAFADGNDLAREPRRIERCHVARKNAFARDSLGFAQRGRRR
ncbi:MAG TPA: hypothetical protein PKE64_28690 [Anaerolineae bacterium]|nr:hypothetical protein [Anaerolineae bacterium]